MRVFFSYGHDEFTEFALRLATDLKNSGYEVWIDRENLRTGSDWESKIEQGLEWATMDQADGRFLLLMSPHSVRRPDGYCLNELARAIELDLPIFPVKVAPCVAPLSIARIQWLDMQDCFPLAERGQPYENKFRLLEDALRSNQLDFEGEQARLLNALAPQDFQLEIRDHTRRFLGRRWVFRAIDDWLKDARAQRIFWIVGDPGVGKTAIAAELCVSRPDIGAAHFCRFGDDLSSDPVAAISSVAYQLATQMPSYMDRLASVNLRQIGDNAQTRFRRLIAEPLRTVRDVERPVIVVIDALDEATAGERNELAAVLARPSHPAPDWLRFVVTSRDRPEVNVNFQDIEAFPIERTAEDHENDLDEFIHTELAPLTESGEISPATNAALIEASERLFVYLEVLRDGLSRGWVDLYPLKALPRGLGNILLQYFEKQFRDRDEFNQSILPLLQVLVAADLPVPREMLARLFDWDERERVERLEALQPLFLFSGDGVRAFHKSLVEWLQDRRKSGCFWVLPAQGHQKLAEFGWRQYGQHKLEPYFLKNLPLHLFGAERMNDLAILLEDLELAVHRIAAGLISVVVRDHARLLRHPPPSGVSPLLKDFAKVCRLSLPSLASANSPNRVVSVLGLNAARLGGGEIGQRLRDLPFRHDFWVRWQSLRAVDPHQIIAQGAGSGEFSIGEVNGTPVVVAGYAGRVGMWNAQTGAPCWPPIPAHPKTIHGDYVGGVCDVVLASLGGESVIVSAGRDGRVALRDISNGSVVEESEELGNRVTFLAVADWLETPRVVAFAEGQVRFLDAKTLKLVGCLAGAGESVNPCAMKIVDQSILMAVFEEEGVLQLWDLLEQTRIGEPVQLDPEARHIALGMVGSQHLVAWVGTGGDINVRSVESREQWLFDDCLGQGVTALRVDHFGDMPVLLAGTYQSHVYVWDLLGRSLVRAPMVGHTSTVVDVRVAVIDETPSIVSTGLGGEVRRWFPSADEQSGPGSNALGYGRIACGLLDEHAIVVAAAKDRIELLDQESGGLLGDPIAVEGWQTGMIPVALAIARVGGVEQILAAYWNAGFCFLLRPDGSTPWEPFFKFPFNVNSMQVVERSGVAVAITSGTDSGETYLAALDLESKELLSDRRRFPGGLSCADVVDECVMIFTVGNGEVRAWDIEKGLEPSSPIETNALIYPERAELAIVRGEPVLLLAADRSFSAVSPVDGRILAYDSCGFGALSVGRFRDRPMGVTGNHDGTLRVWDLEMMASSLTIDVGSPIRDIAVTETGVVLCLDFGLMMLDLELNRSR